MVFLSPFPYSQSMLSAIAIICIRRLLSLTNFCPPRCKAAPTPNRGGSFCKKWDAILLLLLLFRIPFVLSTLWDKNQWTNNTANSTKTPFKVFFPAVPSAHCEQSKRKAFSTTSRRGLDGGLYCPPTDPVQSCYCSSGMSRCRNIFN